MPKMLSLVALLLTSTAVFALSSCGDTNPSTPPAYLNPEPPVYNNYTTWIPGPTHGTDTLALRGLAKLKLHKATHASNSTCTLKNAHRRKEWDSFTKSQKLAYIAAVKCMTTLPSISGDLVPGARTRLDDFVGTHVNQTRRIHATANFLSWHRYFVYTYESALRDECGYEGYQPYAAWGRYTNSVIGSPLFDGSETSISGNGVYSPHPPSIVGLPGPNALPLPPGVGGGCITTGPFKDVKVNLGPVHLTGINDTAPNPRADGLGYNPRCIRRDLSVESAIGASDANTTKLITNNSNIADFQNEMQALFFAPGEKPYYGVHTGGHFMVGGDPGGDAFTSPGDMWFFLHHAMIDRVWWVWQNMDIETRTQSIAGTITFINDPPSRNATLDDVIDVGVNDGFRGIRIRDAMSTTEGPFCYIYE
ncbi:tyrosinase central domain-containing protein [Zymoseptoria brevis]|uniref:Tyrosinase central domain-containing protein n=1 Tax=Zymoseptoria brevis TaxID=1047168 RepID=A0A0F4GHY4_9PEZI|nr:tyrosinase central domain-containing protein [Zymoseptoria brevis]